MSIYELLDGEPMWNPFARPQDITPTKAITKMNNGWEPFILDVRGHGETNQTGVIKGTDLIHPHTSIRKAMKKIPRDKDILITCKGGMRSNAALETLVTAGFEKEKLHNLKGGFMGWSRAGGPTEKS